MDAIFELPPRSPLAEAFSEEWSLLPLRVPMGWNVVYNTLLARRLPDGRVEVNDSEDLFWVRTARPPWLTGRLQVPGSCGWSGCDRLGCIAEQARAS
ncbi:hypothetical protein ACFXPN_46185 [Streptomyces griseorubiginosus]|uniref:hypothetical protein n=1 Tax=Streptomyces griseorubiginosus TaxID=67304 RepID=UPI0036C817B1